MTEVISEFFVGLFNDNVALATIIISTIPLIELRGAIPFGTNANFWHSEALTNWSSYGWSVLGSSLVVPILALLFIPIMKLLKRIKFFNKIAMAIENRIHSKASSIGVTNQECKIFSAGYWKKFFAILIFVAVPLPLTGVWTGTCLAIFIGLDYMSTCLSVITGNIIAGLMVTLILEFFPALNNWLFYIFLIIVAIVLIYSLIKYLICKKECKQKNKNN